MRARARTLALLGLLALRPASLAAAPLELPAATSYGQRVPTRLLCDPAAWPRPVDGALCDAARLLARRVASAGGTLEGAERDLLARWAPFLALRQGVPDPRVHAILVQDARYVVVLDELEKAAGRIPEGHRIGLGLAPLPDGAVGVLLSIEGVVLPAPFPRRPGRGSRPRVEGLLAKDVRLREALLQTPGGETRPVKLSLPASPGSFDLRLPALSEAGEYRFQLIVDRGHGPEVGLLAPLWVEVPEPEAPARVATTGAPGPGEGDDRPPTDQAHLLLARLRQAEGLEPLRRDATLDAAALTRARTMAAERRVVHEPERGPNARTLLESAGFRHRFLAEDVALGPSVRLAFESLLASPAHRGALLETRADKVGIGTEETGDGVYLAVLLTGSRPPPLATPLARELDRQRALLELYQAIREERRAASLGPARRDPELDEVAQTLAGQLAAAGRTRDPGATARATELLRDREPRPRGAFVDVVVAPEVLRAATAPAALHPDCRELGLGAAVGLREGLEQAWVVLLCVN
ncbi:MAG: CAP domain-containing protein [Deltaproteobacteria bacterium]|nr:CAP domain-containing protein [Deltaproteobacteria bacterium]